MDVPRFQIESKIPAQFEVGHGNVLLVRGWVLPKPGVEATRFLVEIAGRRTAIPFASSLRFDLARDSRIADSAERKALSGFWLPIAVPREAAIGDSRLTLSLELDDGTIHLLVEQPIGLVERLSPPPAPAGKKMAICLTTYRPDFVLFERQIDSLIAQQFSDFTCLVRDDASPLEDFRRIEAICARDPRFRVTRNPHNLGFYRNFEACLRDVPPDAQLIALCDQDDYWYPEKLAQSVAKMTGDTRLVYSDMRLVDTKGRVIADSYWVTRKNNFEHMDVLLLANTVTGAASVFDRKVLDAALPFPELIGTAFHDHWLACVAIALGRIDYIDRPLYDYTQHTRNVIGHAGFAPWGARRALAGLSRAAKVALAPHTVPGKLISELNLYYLEYRRLHLYQLLLDLRAPGLTGAKRRAVDLFTDQTSDALKLALGTSAKSVVRGNLTDLVEVRLGTSMLLERGLRRFLPALVPPYNVARGLVARARGGAAVAEPASLVDRARSMTDKIAPLQLKIDPAEPRRINFLIPEIDFRHVFGGYIGKFNLALELARRGHSVRMVIVDPCHIDREGWKRSIANYQGLEDFFDLVAVEYAQPRSQALRCNPRDSIIASTWWTAHIAAAAARDLGRARFLYLIQEFEPFTFPMGAWYAMAEASYEFPHHALFSTALLRDYFARVGAGIYGAGGGEGAYFENAILKYPPRWESLVGRTPRRLLFYCRPEEHAARNMFEVGVAALGLAIEQGAFSNGEWEFHGIGASRADRLALPDGRELNLMERVALSDYGAVLGRHDLGLSLMYTPHPSLVPIEMAAAGMIVVTNRCLNKDAAALGAISKSFVVGEPTIDGVARALGVAAAAVTDIERRRAGAEVRWASSWKEAFHPALVAQIEGWLA